MQVIKIKNGLTILAKSSIWDAWLGPAFASAGGYETALKFTWRYLSDSR